MYTSILHDEIIIIFLGKVDFMIRIRQQSIDSWLCLTLTTFTLHNLQLFIIIQIDQTMVRIVTAIVTLLTASKATAFISPTTFPIHRSTSSSNKALFASKKEPNFNVALSSAGASVAATMVLMFNTVTANPLVANAESSRQVGNISASGLVFKDTLVIESFDDPKVQGISILCNIHHMKNSKISHANSPHIFFFYWYWCTCCKKIAKPSVYIIVGVTLYISNFQRPLTERVQKDFFSDPSSAGVTCVKTGPIKVADNIAIGPEGEEVFKENRSLLFKSLRVQRVYDQERNTAIYTSFSSRLNKNDDTNNSRFKSSICAIALD